MVRPLISNLDLVDWAIQVYKTLRLFLKRDMKPNDDEPRLNGVTAIYRQVQAFVKQHGRIPHFFLNPDNRSDGECLFNCDDEPRHIKAQQHRNMLTAVNTCISFLQVTNK